MVVLVVTSVSLAEITFFICSFAELLLLVDVSSDCDEHSFFFSRLSFKPPRNLLAVIS